jgi:hypothetical protein
LPEHLEVSKLIHIMTNQFKFNIDQLYRMFNNISKESFVEILKNNKVIVSEDNINAIIEVDDNLAIYTILNLPNKMNKEQLIDLIGLKKISYIRLYKQCLFWILVLETENAHLSTVLSEIKVGNENLRYEVIYGKDIKRKVVKKINNHHIYKDINDHKEINNTSIRKGSNTDSSNLSWRKKNDIE